MFHLFVLVFPTISNCSIVLSNGPKQLTNISKRKPLGMPENKVTCFVSTLFCISFIFVFLRIVRQLRYCILYIRGFFQIGGATKFCASHILSFCSLLGFNTILLAACISTYKQTQTRQISVGNDLPERLISQGGQIGYRTYLISIWFKMISFGAINVTIMTKRDRIHKFQT